MAQMSVKNEWEKYWKKYENSQNGQVTYLGGHSTRTDSLNNLPNKDIGLQMGSMAITTDAVAFIYDSILKEWIQQ